MMPHLQRETTVFDPPRTDPKEVPQAVYFGPPGARLFGWYHPGYGAGTSGRGVVLCSPLADEAIMTHRTYRHLAEELAYTGLPTLRFDYHGTGDSSGDDYDPGRLRAWLDSVGMAIAELKARSRVEDVSLFGVRLGGSLAALAAAEYGPVHRLVLWGPCVTGTAYVRELRALRMMGALAAPPPSRVNHASSIRYEESAGFVLTESTLADLAGIDLRKLPHAPAPSVLIVKRDDLPGQEERLAQSLGQLGVEVTMQERGGYAAMMKEAHNSVLPHDVCRTVVGWLSSGRNTAQVERVPDPWPGAGDRPGVPTSSGPPPGTAVSISGPAGLVEERAVTFGADGQLFGILCTPPASRGSRSETAVLFLNAGGVPHVGPNRMYVAMSRRLAGLGFATLRFDISGIGDSAWRDAIAGRMYSRDAVADVHTAIRYLSANQAIRRFCLVGLCSGAYAAFYAALEAPGIAAQILINPETFFFTPGDSLDIRIIGTRQIWNRDNWRKLLRGKIETETIVWAIDRQRHLLGVRLSNLLPHGSARPRSFNLGSALQTVFEKQIDTLLVYSRDDPGLDYLRAHLGRRLSWLQSRPDFRLQIIDGPDHTFTPVWSQERLSEIVVDHLCRLVD